MVRPTMTEFSGFHFSDRAVVVMTELLMDDWYIQLVSLPVCLFFSRCQSPPHVIVPVCSPLVNPIRKWNFSAPLLSTVSRRGRRSFNTRRPRALRREISNFQRFDTSSPQLSLPGTLCALHHWLHVHGVRHLLVKNHSMMGWRQKPFSINSIMQLDRTKSTNLRKHQTILSTSCYEIDFLMLKKKKSLIGSRTKFPLLPLELWHNGWLNSLNRSQCTLGLLLSCPCFVLKMQPTHWESRKQEYMMFVVLSLCLS